MGRNRIGGGIVQLNNMEVSMNKLVLTALAATLTGGVAFAQDASSFVKVTPSDKMATNLIDLDVYNGQNQDVGTIKDIVLASGDSVSGYVLSVGGFLGMGTRYVIVDPKSVKIVYDRQDKKWHANMSATADQLKNAPEFKYEGKADASKT
jgi:sporulation protein YlmC with PRC-barrel domain